MELVGMFSAMISLGYSGTFVPGEFPVMRIALQAEAARHGL
jgi:hypothetical protein